MSKELPLVVQYRIVDMGEIKYASLPPRHGPAVGSLALLCNMPSLRFLSSATCLSAHAACRGCCSHHSTVAVMQLLPGAQGG